MHNETKIYTMLNSKFLLALPMALGVINLVIGGSYELVNILSWLLGGVVITIGFGMTIVVYRIEITKSSVKKVFAFRSKTIELSNKDQIEVNDKYIFVKNSSNKIIMMVSRKIMKGKEFNSLVDDLRELVR